MSAHPESPVPPAPADADRFLELYRRAAELAAGESLALERSADAPLLREVRSLLAAGERMGSFLERPAATLAVPPGPGSVVGGYRILDRLGRGGMGQVFRAQPEAGGEDVALKTVVAPGESLVAGIRREIRTLARIRHPGVVRILAEGIHEGWPWYAMDLLDGAPLDLGAWNPEDPVELAAALDTLARLCDTLAHLHGEGIVHGDLKPGNILVCDGRPRLVDFGLMVELPRGISREVLRSVRGASGTAAYAAPEQWSAELWDARVDLYAVGVMLHEVATGALPFEDGPRGEMLWRKLSLDPSPPSRIAPAIPPALEEIIVRLLARDPRQRPGYAEDVASALDALAARIDPGVPRTRSAPPGPPAKPYLYRATIVGRDRVRALLDARLGVLRRGEGGGLLALGGPSGAGKTRQVMDAARLAAERALPMLTATCAPSFDPRGGIEGPLQALEVALRAMAQACRDGGVDEARRILGPDGWLLIPYCRELETLASPDASRTPPPRPEEARARLFAALDHALAELAGERGLVLLLDDLQWADRLSLAFLESGMRRALPRLLVVATYRTEEVGPELAALLRAGHVASERLERLGADDAARMAAEMLGSAGTGPDAAEAPIATLVSRAEGNPFFVGEYLRAAIAGGLLQRDGRGRWLPGARWDDARSLPDTLASLIARRLDLLPGAEAAVLAIGALMGRDLEDALLASAVAELEGADAARLTDALADLVARELLEDAAPGRLRFVHEELRVAAAARVDPARRRRLHRGIAATLAEAADAAERDAEIGRHWEEAGHPEKALPCYLAAARRAVARIAYDDARDLYRAAMRLATAGERVRAAFELAEVVLLPAGRTREMEELLREAAADAVARSDAALETACRRALGRALCRLGRPVEGRVELEAAMAIAERAGDAAAKHQIGRTLLVLLLQEGKLGEARRALEASLAVAEQQGNLRDVARDVRDLADIDQLQGHVARAAEGYLRATRMAAEIGDRLIEGAARSELGEALLELGRLEEAGASFEEAIRIFEELRRPGSLAWALASVGPLHTARGDTVRARELLERALALHQQVEERRGEGHAQAGLAEVAFVEGDARRARELCDAARRLYQGAGDRAGAGNAGILSARIARLLEGAPHAALDEAGEAEGTLEALGYTLHADQARVERGHALLALGREAEVQGVLAALEAREPAPAAGSRRALAIAALRAAATSAGAGAP